MKINTASTDRFTVQIFMRSACLLQSSSFYSLCRPSLYCMDNDLRIPVRRQFKAILVHPNMMEIWKKDFFCLFEGPVSVFAYGNSTNNMHFRKIIHQPQASEGMIEDQNESKGSHQLWVYYFFTVTDKNIWIWKFGLLYFMLADTWDIGPKGIGCPPRGYF